MRDAPMQSIALAMTYPGVKGQFSVTVYLIGRLEADYKNSKLLAAPGNGGTFDCEAAARRDAGHGLTDRRSSRLGTLVRITGGASCHGLFPGDRRNSPGRRPVGGRGLVGSGR